MNSGIITYNLLIVTVFLLCGTAVHAQIISPGKLSKAHSFLDGISHCTTCHELGKPGITNDKCLECHTPIQQSIENLEGLHGRAEIIEQSCAGCHVEHFGSEFDVLHFDSTDFDHSKTGFDIDGAHSDISCESCHDEPSFFVDDVLLEYQKKFDLTGSHDTFLGLDSECAACHMADNVHGDQFIGESCEFCHTTTEFADVSTFDHNTADFKLTGQHIDVTCEECHQQVAFEDSLMIQFVGIESDMCTDCHEDVHEGRFTELKSPPQTCESCHTTDGWHLLGNGFQESAFDHSDTGYALVGSHMDLTCESCHTKRDDALIRNSWVSGNSSNSYPKPESDTCMNCHVDYHDGVFTHSQSDTDCQSCHTIDAWYPSTFGLEAHNEISRFELLGAHVATPCFSCHQPDDGEKPTFVFSDISCISCHKADNPHGVLAGLWEGSKSDDCASCHNEQSWTDIASFDHEGVTGYALTGAHTAADCASCHFEGESTEIMIFSAISTECASCHEPDSPHRGQFEFSVLGPDCETCHTTQSFRLESFDHTRTSFALDGAHINVTCVDCHVTETAPDGSRFNRFFPLSSECSSCHDK